MILPNTEIFQFYEGTDPEFYSDLTGVNLNKAPNQLVANDLALATEIDAINNINAETLGSLSELESASVAKEVGFLSSNLQVGESRNIFLDQELDGLGKFHVTVTKEIADAVLEEVKKWQMSSSGEGYEPENFAVAANVTPSGVSGRITLTLSTGTWRAEDVGRSFVNRVAGAAGEAVIVGTPGSASIEAQTTVTFSNTALIPSGSWSLHSVDFTGSGLRVSGITDRFLWKDWTGSSTQVLPSWTDGSKTVSDFNVTALYGNQVMAAYINKADSKAYVQIITVNADGTLTGQAPFLAIPDLLCTKITDVKVLWRDGYAGRVVLAGAGTISGIGYTITIAIDYNGSTGAMSRGASSYFIFSVLGQISIDVIDGSRFALAISRDNSGWVFLGGDYVYIATVDAAKTITWGTGVAFGLTTTKSYNVQLTVVNGNRLVVSYTEDGFLKSDCFSYSGNVLVRTHNSTYALHYCPATDTRDAISTCKLDDDSFLIAYNNNNNAIIMMVCTIGSTGLIAINSTTTIEQSSAAAWDINLRSINTTDQFITYSSTSGSVARTIALLGNSVQSLGTKATSISGSLRGAAVISSNQVLLFKKEVGDYPGYQSTQNMRNSYSINQYSPAFGKASANIDTTYWNDIDMVDVDETGAVINGTYTWQSLSKQKTYYAFTLDAAYDALTENVSSGTYFIIGMYEATARNIISDRLSVTGQADGVWCYNSDLVYSGSSWTAAPTNNKFSALKTAMSLSINRMDGLAVKSAMDNSWPAVGTMFNHCRILYSTDVNDIPLSKNMVVDYTASTKVILSVPNVDYILNNLSVAEFRFEALTAGNYRVYISKS